MQEEIYPDFIVFQISYCEPHILPRSLEGIRVFCSTEEDSYVVLNGNVRQVLSRVDEDLFRESDGHLSELDLYLKSEVVGFSMKNGLVVQREIIPIAAHLDMFRDNLMQTSESLMPID